MTRRALTVLIAVALIVGAVAPAVAVTGTSEANGTTNSVATTSVAANNTSVNVTVGQQLSTIIAQTDSEVRTEVEESAFEVRYEGANESERAEAIADRAEELRERAQEIREEYREATQAYESGEISKSEYAQRIATLNARAEDLTQSINRLQKRAENVSALELRAAGFNQSELRASSQSLDSVTGVGAAALLKRYTGQSQGEIEIETRNGLTIEVSSEDGEQSREFERPRDENNNISTSQSEALDAARTALGTPEQGNWSLRKASVHQESGYYKFEFALTGTNATGEAEVRVDGSSGEVFKLESEIQQPEAEDEGEEAEEEREDERENETESDELALIIASGSPAPNATVTLKALSAGQPVEGATVTLNGEEVGTTGADGTVTVTLPASGEATIRVTTGDAEGELEFEFEEREDEIERNLRATGSIDNGTVTVQVTYNGSGVEGATVYAAGRQVGTTNADGTLTFETNASEELEVTIVKGEFEAELTFEVRNGTLTLTKSDVGGAEDDQETDEQETEDDTSDSDSTEDTSDSDTDSDSTDSDSDSDSTDSDSNDSDDTDETETPEE